MLRLEINGAVEEKAASALPSIAAKIRTQLTGNFLVGHIRQDDGDAIGIALDLLHSNDNTCFIRVSTISDLDVGANRNKLANLTGKEFDLGGITQLGGIAGPHLDGGAVQTKDLAAETDQITLDDLDSISYDEARPATAFGA